MIRHRNAKTSAPARVVVLGQKGFVASELIGLLGSRDVETVPLSSRTHDLRREETAEELKRILRPDDRLVFTSALTPDRGRDAKTLVDNLLMAKTVCQALAEAPVRHLVYISSDAVYSDASGLIGEWSPCDPTTLHGLMHLTRERLLEQTALRHQFSYTVMRPTLLFGAGDTHNGYGPNRFIRSALADRRITLFGEGEERRDHVYVRDLCRLIALVLWHQSEGVLNVASGVSASFREIARQVARCVGNGVEVCGVPRQSAVTHRHFDVTERLRSFPGFASTPLDQALATTVSRMTEPAPARVAP
ncbi:MAG: NAD-dependent epimerase/dehydratase [Isosphaeraceae bacterium]